MNSQIILIARMTPNHHSVLRRCQDTNTRPAQDLAAILAEVPSLRTEFEAYRARAAEDQAFDRRRIDALEKGKIQPALKALIAANGGS